MNKPKKQSTVGKAICALTIIAAAGAGGSLLLRNAHINTLKNSILGIGESENVETLKRLNADWVLPDGYSLEIIEVDGLVMELTQADSDKPSKAILQLHGGSYTRSLKDNGVTYRRAAAQYASICGAAVLTPDYRVAPEHPYPAALEDAFTAYKWLMEQGYAPESIIIAGDSAGGGLTLALTLYLRDNGIPLPAAVITMSAWTNLDYKRYTPPYAHGSNAKDPYISPVYGEYTGFPPMLMQVGGSEALLSDTHNVAQKAIEAEIAVQYTSYPGMFHVFQMLFPELTCANEAWDEIRAFIDEIFDDQEVNS